MERDNKNKGEESLERRFRGQVNSTIGGLNLLFGATFFSHKEGEFPRGHILVCGVFVFFRFEESTARLYLQVP